MLTYFADAWFFIALVDRHDAHHRQAHQLAEHVLSARVLTHDSVLTEVLAFFADDGAIWRRAAVKTVRAVLSTYEVVAPDRALFLRALDRYERRADKEYSLVDCMSMIVMEELGITHVLTNDHRFTQAGFTVVNE